LGALTQFWTLRVRGFINDDFRMKNKELNLIESFKHASAYALALAELQNRILQMMIDGKKCIDLEDLDNLIVELKTKQKNLELK